jgi:hypothetical protein
MSYKINFIDCKGEKQLEEYKKGMQLFLQSVFVFQNDVQHADKWQTYSKGVALCVK